MKAAKVILILTLSIFFCTHGFSQFYKRFDFEIGANRSKISNTSEMFPSSIYGEDKNNLSPVSEAPVYTNNYSMSLGFHITQRHHLRIRRSHNTIGSIISGTFFPYGQLCGVGLSPFTLRNAHNVIKSKTMGIVYELDTPINGGNFLVGIGFEKQWNSYEDTFVFANGIITENYAVHSYMGMQVPLYSLIHLHSKVFVTRTFSNNIQTGHIHHESKYIPIQIGMELGLRLNFDSLK